MRGFHGEKRLGEKFDLRTAETVTRFASVCNRSADTGLNSVCFCWNLHAASRALCLRSLFSELWPETAERPEAAPANGYRRGLAAAAGRRRQCGGAAATVRLQRRRYTSLLGGSPVFMSLASRGVEYSRKQRIIGGLVGVRAYYRERWALRAVQYVGCKAQLIKRRDASVGQYARGRLQWRCAVHTVPAG